MEEVVISSCIDIMHEWCYNHDTSQYPDMLRFIAHLMIYYVSQNPDLKVFISFV